MLWFKVEVPDFMHGVCSWQKPCFFIGFESRWQVVSYSLDLHHHLSIVRDPSLALLARNVGQVTNYSRSAAPRYFANQLIK